MSERLTIRDATLHLSADGGKLTINVDDESDDGFGTFAYPVDVSASQQYRLGRFFEHHGEKR
jgi:hypothetical protein